MKVIMLLETKTVERLFGSIYRNGTAASQRLCEMVLPLLKGCAKSPTH